MVTTGCERGKEREGELEKQQAVGCLPVGHPQERAYRRKSKIQEGETMR